MSNITNQIVLGQQASFVQRRLRQYPCHRYAQCLVGRPTNHPDPTVSSIHIQLQDCRHQDSTLPAAGVLIVAIVQIPFVVFTGIRQMILLHMCLANKKGPCGPFLNFPSRGKW